MRPSKAYGFINVSISTVVFISLYSVCSHEQYMNRSGFFLVSMETILMLLASQDPTLYCIKYTPLLFTSNKTHRLHGRIASSCGQSQFQRKLRGSVIIRWTEMMVPKGREGQKEKRRLTTIEEDAISRLLPSQKETFIIDVIGVFISKRDKARRRDLIFSIYTVLRLRASPHLLVSSTQQPICLSSA